LNAPWNAAHLAQFEQANNIRLPEEYASFLTVIGNGGAGPDAGLRKLPMILSDLERSYARLSFSCTNEQSLAFRDVTLSEVHLPGTIVITDLDTSVGESWSFLVITGEQRGTVWNSMAHSGPKPAHNWQRSDPEFTRDGRQATFLPWYEGWLDGRLAFWQRLSK
jgi:hypothetical protein